MRVKIGSRSSDLAKMQAYMVGEKLTRLGVDVEFNFRESLGDLNPDIDLSKTTEKGVFTQDFYQGLLDGTYDIVVHSWKDLPTEERPGTQVVATLQRADMRDVLVFKPEALQKKIKSLKIFSSSPRRAYNLESFLTEVIPIENCDVKFTAVRGNVQTRFRKLLEDPEVHGLIVAKAALDRMLSTPSKEFEQSRSFLRQSIDGLKWMVLPLSVNPCAAAQGALALEIREKDSELQQLLVDDVNCTSDWENVLQEREILKAFGGGCHQKIGVSVLSRPYGTIISLQGRTDDGQVLNRFEIRGKKPLSSPVSRERVYPLPEDEGGAFRRLVIPQKNPRRDLWLAKAVALPEDWSIEDSQLVWAAGLRTWRQLAARGVWVNGSTEGLGEHEGENVTVLLGRSPDWVKLTHSEGVATEGKDLVPTYSLQGDFEVPSIEKKEYFYWASGSQFLSVWQKYPQILSRAHHACGPGHTSLILKNHLPHASKIEIFLNRDQWWNVLGIT